MTRAAAGPEAGIVWRTRLIACGGVVATALALALVARMERRWFVLVWVTLVPWLAALDGARSLRRTVCLALLMSIGFVLGAFSWFAGAIAEYTGATYVQALVVVVALAPILEPQLLAFAVTRHLVRRGGGSWWCGVLSGACVYVGTEWASPKLFADTLGHGLYPSPWLRQAADVAGAHGLTVAVIVGNECVLAAARALRAGGAVPLRRALTALAPLAGILTALAVYGAVRCAQLATPSGSEDAIAIAAIQADLSHYDRLAAEIGTFEAVRTILQVHFGLSAEVLAHARPDVLVWPETVYPTTFGRPKSDDGAAFDRAISAFVAHAGIPLIFGSYDLDAGDEYNAAFFLEPSPSESPSFQTYRKAMLFPLTERVPALLELDVVRRWLPWLGTWKPGVGANVVTLTLDGGRRLPIAPLICYDALDPRLVLAAVRQGAELIVTLSNDSWLAIGTGPRQHLVGAAFLSIEARRAQVRATNTGISAIIDPAGTIVASADVHERTTLLATVTPRRGSRTLMVAWGEWFGPTALVLGAGLLALALVRGAVARRRVRGLWRSDSPRL